MSKQKPRDEQLSFECELSESPEQVWRALTEPELLAAWLMPNDFRAEIGATFSFQPESRDESAPIQCKVLELVPHERLRYSWREQTHGAPETDVTFQLTRSRAGGTHLRLIHAQASQSVLGQLLFLPLRSSSGGSTPTMRCAA